ncbi:hypothetical protein V1478_000196 [Vespula squamosa]|uniref:Uncharacterized protein n=1 Tax=Vespula squamosa TaxID=30214 RepID=A0ABD2C4T9_VESSQ
MHDKDEQVRDASRRITSRLRAPNMTATATREIAFDKRTSFHYRGISCEAQTRRKTEGGLRKGRM